MTPRVLLISGEYPPMRGGVGDYTARLVEALAALGWEASVLTSRAASSSTDPRVLARIGEWNWSLHGDAHRAARETHADVVHIQYQTGAFGMHPAVNALPIRLGRRTGRPPLVTTFHDLLPPYLFPKAGPLRGRVTQLMARGSNAVIVTNPDDEAALARLRRLAPRLRLIPIGGNLPEVDDAARHDARARLELTDGETTVGFFGFLTRDKGLDLLLGALEALDPPRPRLVLIGGGLAETDVANCGYVNRLQEQLDRTSVTVTQTGHLSPYTAAATLGAVDLVVLPFRDGASLRRGTLIAATRSGVPVLTTDAGHGELLAPLVSGESVWLVPANDVDALRKAIRTLLGDRALRQRLAAHALDAAQSFNWNTIGRAHVELYETLLARQ